MSDENQEEVEPQTNSTEEEETPKEPEAAPKPQGEPKEAPNEPSEKEKRLYARLKKEEEARKKLEQKLQEAKKQADPTNVDKILEVQTATKGLVSDEIAELKLRAEATGKSLLEAREDENFKIWQKAYKQKVEEEKAPSPSTTQGTDDSEPEPVSIHSFGKNQQGFSPGAKEFFKNLTPEETEQWLDGLTFNGVPIEKIPGMTPKGIAAFKKEVPAVPKESLKDIVPGETPKFE